MDSEKGNAVFARGHNVPPPPLVFGAQKKPGWVRVNHFIGLNFSLGCEPGRCGLSDLSDLLSEHCHKGADVFVTLSLTCTLTCMATSS